MFQYRAVEQLCIYIFIFGARSRKKYSRSYAIALNRITLQEVRLEYYLTLSFELFGEWLAVDLSSCTYIWCHSTAEYTRRPALKVPAEQSVWFPCWLNAPGASTVRCIIMAQCSRNFERVVGYVSFSQIYFKPRCFFFVQSFPEKRKKNHF